jgi:putative thiamine transport system ATP-binding protein
MTMQLKNICITLNGKSLIAPFDLTVADGEMVTIMGPSGCGKSSLLAFIAGDLQPPLEGRGEIKLNDVDLGTLRPELRKVGRLFQDDLLFPHLTVGENLIFGMPRNSETSRSDMVRIVLQRIELNGFENRMPHTLSGGERARVSLMRALVAKPDCMLLDEPFNKLDQELRDSMRTYVFSHLRARNIPSIIVTHDIEDAPAGGRIFRIGKDQELTRV